MNYYDQYTTDKESLRQWESNPNIRQEFDADYESFKHFRRAEAAGLIKIQGTQHV